MVLINLASTTAFTELVNEIILMQHVLRCKAPRAYSESSPNKNYMLIIKPEITSYLTQIYS